MTFAPDTAGRPKFFMFGWEARAQGPREMALHLQALNRRMAEVEPEWRDLWPLFAARMIKPGRDPGPILDLSPDELALLIDRKARVDPPRYPSPVDRQGYSLFATVLRNGHDPLGVTVRSSTAYEGATLNDNEVHLDPHKASPIWDDFDRMLRLFLGGIEATSATWALNVAFMGPKLPYRQLMIWTGAGAATPSRYADGAPEPSEVRPHLGGELRIWR